MVNLGELLATIAVLMLVFRTIDIFADFRRRRAEETATTVDDQLVPIIRLSMRILVSAIAVLFALQNLNVDIGSLLAGLGIGGLAVALAAQDTLKNLLGGATIFADKPFQIGDCVLIGDLESTVERIGFRSTRVRTSAAAHATTLTRRIGLHRGRLWPRLRSGAA